MRWGVYGNKRDTKRRSRVKFYVSKVSFVVFYAPRHLLEAVRRLLLVEQVNNQEDLSGYRTPNAVRLC